MLVRRGAITRAAAGAWKMRREDDGKAAFREDGAGSEPVAPFFMPLRLAVALAANGAPISNLSFGRAILSESLQTFRDHALVAVRAPPILRTHDMKVAPDFLAIQKVGGLWEAFLDQSGNHGERLDMQAATGELISSFADIGFTPETDHNTPLILRGRRHKIAATALFSLGIARIGKGAATRWNALSSIQFHR